MLIFEDKLFVIIICSMDLQRHTYSGSSVE